MVCDCVQEHYCFKSHAHWEPWETETRAPCQCSREDLEVRRKGALSPAPHYRSCQPPSTNMRGPTVAWGLYLELVSAAQRWLILYSYHSAPWDPQLLSPCHHKDSVAATLQFLPSQSSPWQGLIWCWGLVAAEVGAQSPCVLLRVVVCYACAAFEGAPTVYGMQHWVCWMRGLPKGRGGKGVGSTEKG